MERPKTIIHILSALDGKITGPFMGLPQARETSEEYGRIRAAYQADAWLYGTVTTKEFTGFRRPVLDEGKGSFPEGDYIAEKNAALYYVSADALGEIGWESGTFQKAGRPDMHVIEVLTEQAPGAYRAFLRERGVSYIVAGRDSLDCRTASRKLYQLFGIRTLLICGGGGINWTFLQQGVVDEISLVIAPAADGECSTVTVFEKSPLLTDSRPMGFHLKTAERIGKDGVHLLYTVDQRDGAAAQP